MRLFDIPMEENDAEAKTIGEYLKKLFCTLWEEGEGFSGKHPFGNSGWQYDVYAALIKAGVVNGKLDSNGYVDEIDYGQADDVILKVIEGSFALETLLQNYESAIDTKKRLAAKIEQLQSELEQVKRERNVAVNEIKACYDIQGIDDYYPIYDLGICMCCSHYSDDVDRANGEELACGDCQNASNWQWHKVKEADHETD